MKRSLSKKPKQSKQDKFWELFAGFCFGMNETGTYSELIDRVKFFNANQTILKKLPVSANERNACMLRHARLCLLGRPKQAPDTLYDYKRMVVKSLYEFTTWLQDSFQILFAEQNVYDIMLIAESVLPRRFKTINPEASYIEETALILKLQAQNSGDLSDGLLNKLDAWRKTHQTAFWNLQAFWNTEKLPKFSRPDMATCNAIRETAKPEQRELFYWPGKEICKFLAELSETPGTKLCYKGDIFDHDKELKARFSTHVHKIAQSNEEQKPMDMEKNHYIEGDNLRALRLLTPQYEGKIKMIYIDPPYNTGRDFVYRDSMKDETEIYRRFLFTRMPTPSPDVVKMWDKVERRKSEPGNDPFSQTYRVPKADKN